MPSDPMKSPGQLLGDGSTQAPALATSNCSTQVHYQRYTIVQGCSRFKSTIVLGENASLDQGNIFDGSPSESFRQEGSEFGGDIQGGKSARLCQGNRINGRKAKTSENDSPESKFQAPQQGDGMSA
ncbi:hypothetical protein TGAM01_v207433 [Trichoderma gamsii]|uniref:Uncharacterized protein n=1 Tax=Trichoderma gamsii TaxID=398673 RepID=A0A2P4ZHL5_9HYPO|nr:hypothetical protein TGAM01_v207433 [Trichoderma gamsii]PON23786.1 hypothetical protein TGAM01_v207433 [Trichoderma gamsii]